MRTFCVVLLLLLHCVSMAGSVAAQEVGVEVGTEVAESDMAELAELAPVELFLRASSSALQFEHMREPSRRILVSNHEESLPYLVTRLDTDDARERHALEDILVRIGPAAAEPVIEAFLHALEDILVRIGTAAAEPVIEAFLLEAGRTETTRGARLAAAVLGRIGEACAVDPLASVHDHHDWKLRGAIGGALGRIGTAETVLPLVSLQRQSCSHPATSILPNRGVVGRALCAPVLRSMASHKYQIVPSGLNKTRSIHHPVTRHKLA